MVELMEIDISSEIGGSKSETKRNGFHLYPVPEGTSGEGMPYAPENWPSPGDMWSWKVGKRISVKGTYLDRYLCLPPNLQKDHKPGAFASKLAVQRFITKTFPGADIDAFFASFSWKIPSLRKAEFSIPDGDSATACCKAGNTSCSSLVESFNPPTDTLSCDLCCSEPDFCRECCCILCCRTSNSICGPEGFIICKALVDDTFVCRHRAHIECGLRSYTAGTVGGSIALDAEYYCRRCDSRMDLVPHVKKIFRSRKTFDSKVEIETILNVCARVLRGSSKKRAKKVLYRIELAMAKLKSARSCERILRTQDESNGIAVGDFSKHNTDASESFNYEDPDICKTGSPQILFGGFDHRAESRKMGLDISQVLLSLKKSQDSEYKVAEENINAQKDHLLYLYKQLDKDRHKLAKCTTSSAECTGSPDPDSLLDTVLKRIDQIKREATKFRDMEAVAKGFGKTPKRVLKEHFHFEAAD